MRPASASPEPDVARPVRPHSCRHRLPSGAAIKVDAPFTATTAFHSRAASRAACCGSASTASLLMPRRCAISPAWGVSSTGWASRGMAISAFIARASRMTGVCVSMGNSRATKAQLPSSSIMPGPTSTASAPCALSSSKSTAWACERACSSLRQRDHTGFRHGDRQLGGDRPPGRDHEFACPRAQCRCAGQDGSAGNLPGTCNHEHTASHLLVGVRRDLRKWPCAQQAGVQVDPCVGLHGIQGLGAAGVSAATVTAAPA